MNIHLKKPCANCPFRKDSQKGWLGEEKAKKITKAESFICHKAYYGKKQRRQCAGFLLVMKEQALFNRLAAAFNKDLKLEGKNLVFECKNQFIKHHSSINKQENE